MDQSQHRIIQGVHFIRVRGDIVERARIHGALLREEIRKGALPVLEKKNEWLIRRGPGLLQIPAVQNLVVKLYKKVIIPLLDRSTTAEIRQGIRAIAAETGLPYEMIREAVYQPDALMLLIRLSMFKHVLPEWMPGGFPGCSSAVVFNDWTKNGKMQVCRNFDYFIVDAWEKNTTVVFNEPVDSSEVPYTFVSTAGVHTGGLTAMNQEGLTLATHAHFGKKISLSGAGVIVIGDEIIRKAKTLGQAIDIARKMRSAANWSFVVSSAQEKDAAVLQITPHGVHAHHAEDGFLAHTNFFHSPELREKEALLSGAYCEDLQARICRMRQILEPHRGSIEPAHLSAALGDHRDYFTGDERVFGNTLSVVTTVKSVVFEPEDQKLWVGSRQESPLGLGKYLEVDLLNFWKKSPSDYEQEMNVLNGYQPQSTKLVEAVHHYRAAYRAFHIENQNDDYQTHALAHLEKAVATYPEDAHVWIQAGIVSFKLKKFKEARAYFEKTKPLALSAHVLLVRDLYLARCLDLAGEREQAVALYASHSQLAKEPKLLKAFKKGLKKPYQEKETDRILIDLQFPDTFEY